MATWKSSTLVTSVPLVKLLPLVDVPGVALLAWNRGTMWSRVFFGSTFHCIISLRTGPAGTPVSVRSGARTFDLVVHDTSGISCHSLLFNNFVDSLLQSWTRTWLTLQPKTGAAETCEAEPSQRSGFFLLLLFHALPHLGGSFI